MKYVIALFMVAFVQVSANAQALLYGFGHDGCAAWLSSPETEAVGDSWILGFWSAANSLNKVTPRVGQSTDAYGIIGEVKKICQEHPSGKLSEAIMQAYTTINNQERNK